MTKFRNSLSTWHAPAILLWSQGRKKEAIDSVLQVINLSKSPKPLDLIKQLSYYLFLIGDYSGASSFLAGGLAAPFAGAFFAAAAKAASASSFLLRSSISLSYIIFLSSEGLTILTVFIVSSHS